MTSPAGAALGGARHCGPGRISGGTYLESNTQKVGLGAFVLDPPQEIDPVQFALPSQGMARLVEEDGSVHFLDRIGRSHYPQAADFLREAQTKGVSRRFPTTLSLEGIDERSTLILLHDRGFPPDPSRLTHPVMPCPQGQHDALEACAAHHFTPDPQGAPERRCAFIMRVPISAIGVVKGPESDKTLDKLRAQGVTPYLAEE